MSDRDNTDLWTAVAVGAVIGIGTALLVRARQDDDTHELLKRLRPLRRSAQNAARVVGKEVRRRTHDAGEAAGDLVSASRDTLDDLRQSAADIVRDTRSELQKAARESVKEMRRASRQVGRRVGR